MIDAITKTVQLAEKVGPQLNKLKKATQDFEAVFFKDILSQMRKSIPKSDVEGSGMGKEIFEDMLDNALAETGAKQGSFGVGKLMFDEFKNQVIREANRK